MSENLGEGDILVADPPVVKAQGDTESAERQEGKEWDDHHVEELLLVVCVGGEKRVRVLGEVVGAVELPQTADIVHHSVVAVEPEVENDAVQADLEAQPSPPADIPENLDGGLVAVIGEVYSHRDPPACCLIERCRHLVYADVGDTVSFVGVSIEVSDLLAHLPAALDLANDGPAEGDKVESKGGYGVEAFVPRNREPGLVEGHGNRGVQENPNVTLPLDEVRDLVGLLVYGCFRPRREGVCVEKVDQVVVQSPL